LHPVAILILLPAASSEANAYAEALVVRAREAKLAEDRGWRTLLHDQPRWFGGQKSTADAESFFLDPEGKMDPEKELAATIRAFFDPPVVETETVQHPQCRFRARFLWLDERLGFGPALLSFQPCARFEWWKGRLGARSLTLVFASAYLNNPASMFGHTFLRLNRKARGAGADLVAYTVNFAANPTTDNAILYAMLGLLGGFPGFFSTLPYYLKVREYTALEHRDLWEYDLAFEPHEIERLIAHLWELGSVYFDYWYLDENCSYQLLALLEVARPSLHLTDRFSGWVIPSDTVRAVLDASGIVVAEHHRPSQYQVMLARRRSLESDELDVARGISEGTISAVDLDARTSDRRRAILDAALELLRYQKRLYASEEGKTREQQILLARGSVHLGSPPVEIPPDDPPERGHGTALLGMGAGGDERGGFLRFTGRIALHDLLDRPAGYVPGSEIEFFRTTLRAPFDLDRAPPPELERFRLLGIASLAPLDPWAFRWSWRLSTGLERSFDRGCAGAHCLFYELRGGPGLSIPVDVGRRLVLFAFLDGSTGVGPAFDRRYRIAAGGSAGASWDIVGPLRLYFEASYLYPPLGDRHASYRLDGALAFDVAQDLEIRAEGVKGPGYASSFGMFLFYF
jgi:hypothetical protein